MILNCDFILFYFILIMVVSHYDFINLQILTKDKIELYMNGTCCKNVIKANYSASLQNCLYWIFINVQFSKNKRRSRQQLLFEFNHADKQRFQKTIIALSNSCQYLQEVLEGENFSDVFQKLSLRWWRVCKKLLCFFKI